MKCLSTRLEFLHGAPSGRYYAVRTIRLDGSTGVDREERLGILCAEFSWRFVKYHAEMAHSRVCRPVKGSVEGPYSNDRWLETNRRVRTKRIDPRESIGQMGQRSRIEQIAGPPVARGLLAVGDWF